MNRLFKHLNALSVLLLVMAGMMWHGVNGVDALTDAEIQSACDGYKLNREQLTADILDSAGLDHVNFDFPDVFKRNKAEPEIKNFYLNIYKKVKQDPADQAINTIADNYGYTKEEMCAILGGSVALLLDDNEDTYQEVETLLDDYQDILDDYADELEKERLQQEMTLDSYGKEMFANGDTEDSSFDVLYDLEIIEYILFGEDTIDSGGGGTTDAAESVDSDGDGPVDDADTETSTTATTSSSTTSSSSSDADDEAEEDTADEEDPLNPLECVVDAGLQGAFAEAGVTPVETEEDEADTADDDDPSSGGGDTSTGSGDADTDGDPDALLTATEAADWNPDEVCDGVFCLIIRFSNKEDTAYEKSDNCIKCHVEYMRDAMNEVISKPLNPNKVTGNAFEPAMCKESYLKAVPAVNLFMIPVPLPTPPPEDVITNMNRTCEESLDLIEDKDLDEGQLLTKWLTLGCSDPEDPETAETELDESTRRRLANYLTTPLDDIIKEQNTQAAGSLSTEALIEEATKQYDEQIALMQQVFQLSRAATQVGAQTDFYQVVGLEMDQMNNYFLGYQTLMASMKQILDEVYDKDKTS
jgi:hypothetical protein